MKIHSINPVFAVADVGATIRWYEQELGFVGDPFPSHEPYAFGILRRDDIEIMLQHVADYQKPDLYDLRDVAICAGIAATYFIGAKVGLSLAFVNVSVSPVWPPAGVAIAALLWFGYRATPGVVLGALLANYLLTDVSLVPSTVIAIGNT